ncbi:hypothetical protein ANO14919_131350 [Xylariales sp. No.14919]|nr:hypothetical protein ANO14919_131350 [Xylariales sp. No.14919]
MSRQTLAERGYDRLGTFALVRYYQIQLHDLQDDKVSSLNKITDFATLRLQDDTDSPIASRRGNSLYQNDDAMRAIQDEQIVNVALIGYLSALTIHCKDLKADRTIHHLGSKATNRHGKETYEARVDRLPEAVRGREPLSHCRGDTVRKKSVCGRDPYASAQMTA